jgi:hypothetical protein
MRLGRTALAQLLMTNVVELRFKRRIEKAGYGDYRRMLCTNDRLLLMSQLGRNILNFEQATQPPKFNPAQKNLIIAWDIFMQNYRCINCNDVEVVAVIKTSPDATEWWNYFNESIAPMPAQQKVTFMNK